MKPSRVEQSPLWSNVSAKHTHFNVEQMTYNIDMEYGGGVTGDKTVFESCLCFYSIQISDSGLW